MKHHLISVLLFLLPVLAHAQDCTPKDYDRLMAEAKRLANDGAYDQAINKLQSAKTCQPQREAEVSREILRVFEKVNGERQSAIKNAEEARLQQQLAKASADEARKQQAFAEKKTRAARNVALFAQKREIDHKCRFE